MGADAAFEALGGWPGVLARLFAGGHLEAEEASAVGAEILSGRTSEAVLGAFLGAFATRGPSAGEVAGLVASLRAAGEPLELEIDPSHVVDTCGTGGDRSGTINVSTLAACVVVGAGGTVCKHGNRAASSRAGTADVLEALGVAVGLGPLGVAQCVAEARFGFCLAPRFHPAMAAVGPVRKALGVPTIFNILGPLANPARAGRQVVGTSAPGMAETMLEVLEGAGADHVMIVYGHDGLDELSVVTRSTILESRRVGHGYERREREVDPGGLGLRVADREDLLGGDAAYNAERARAVLSGEVGPQRAFVQLNAAACLEVAGLAASLEEGLELAGAVLDAGAARDALERLVASSSAAARDGLV